MSFDDVKAQVHDWLGTMYWRGPWRFNEDATLDASGDAIVTFHMPAPRGWRNSPFPGLVALSKVTSNRRFAAQILAKIDAIWSAMLALDRGYWVAEQTRDALREALDAEVLASDLAEQSWVAHGSTVLAENGPVVATVHSLLFRADAEDQHDVAYAQYLFQLEARMAQAVALLPPTLRCAQAILHETDQAAEEVCRDFCATLEQVFASSAQNEEAVCSLKMAA